MRMYMLCVMVLLFGFSLGRKYHGYPEANWTLVAGEQPKDGSYQCRLYSPATWVSVDVVGLDFDKMGEVAFWKLHSYIDGNNKEGRKMPMTVPVNSIIPTPPCPFCNSTFTMLFYLPSTGLTPPAPNDPSLVIRHLPKTKVYVRRFGGYAYAKEWKEEAALLYESLTENKVINIDKKKFIAAGYDSPFWFFFRRNEVWLMQQ